jgi:hypothetical protein
MSKRHARIGGKLEVLDWKTVEIGDLLCAWNWSCHDGFVKGEIRSNGLIDGTELGDVLPSRSQ